MFDQFTDYYKDYLDGTYDCIDRIVINAFNPLLQGGGGFRFWWRQLYGSDTHLDNTHLMRFAGHFSRRIKAYTEKNNIPLVFCKPGQRKDELINTYLPQEKDYVGLFCIFVNRAPGSVMEVKSSGTGSIDIRKKKPYPYVNHYAFHIMDKAWGHIIIRFCPHPPFNAMIILNGHEYVERSALKKGIEFNKEDNCFTNIPNAVALGKIAETMISRNRDGGRVSDVCQRWIYSSCLCFALSLDEQSRTDFCYSFSVYQLEYSRNLLFKRGKFVDTIFNGVIDRTRVTLDIRKLKTIFGYLHRPFRRDGHGKKPRIETIVEKPTYDLTVFKVHFDYLTLKVYSKGEHVLRFEAIVHNAGGLRCGKLIAKFVTIAKMLRGMLYRFMSLLHCVDVSFINSHDLLSWHLPTITKKKHVAGIDLNNPRIRAVMESLIALSIDPFEITTLKIAQHVQEHMCDTNYTTRQAAYDLKKFRVKKIVVNGSKKRRYTVSRDGLKAMCAHLLIKDKVIVPVLSRAGKVKRGRKLLERTQLDVHYENIQKEICQVFKILKIAA